MNKNTINKQMNREYKYNIIKRQQREKGKNGTRNKSNREQKWRICYENGIDGNNRYQWRKINRQNRYNDINVIKV